MSGDSRARERALDPGNSFIVQAPAGSGKTSLLTQRYLRLLALAEEPEEILAITFTRKAAAEMRTRILRGLREVQARTPVERDYERQTRSLASAALARDAERGWQILAAPHRLRIQTIDSFEASIVTRMPWFSRFGFSPESTENAQPIYLEAVRHTLSSMADGPRRDAVVRLLTLFDNHIENLTKALADLVARRDEWLPAFGGIHFDHRDGDRMREELEANIRLLVEPYLKAVRELAPAPHSRELGELAAYAAANLADGGVPPGAIAEIRGWPDATADAIPAWRAIASFLLTKDGGFRKAGGLSVRQGFPPCGKAEKARMAILLDELSRTDGFAKALHKICGLPDPRYTEGQWEVLVSLFRFLRDAVPQLHLQFALRRETDFKEVSLRTANALEEAPGVPTLLAERMDAAIRHILVDEFQDTSVLQMLLLRKLTENWIPGDGRTLFLVGDPMQSIYAWRNARVDLFLRAWEGAIRGLPPLERLQLTRNFRSRRSLIEAFNEEFPKHFAAADNADLGAVRYVHAEADPEETDTCGNRIECHAFLDGGLAAEAEWIAGEVARMQAEDAGKEKQRRIGVLFRAKKNANAVGAALRERGIRFQAIDVDPLAELPVVQDLRSLLAALLSPEDRLSWLSVLRAPWNGLRLGELEAIHWQRGRGSLWEALCEVAGSPAGDLDDDSLLRVRRTVALFDEAYRWRGRVPLKVLLRMLFVNSGAEGYHGDARSRLAAAAFFRVLGEQDEGEVFGNTNSFDDALARLHAPPDPEAPETLQLLTIHKAKGLEFDAVFLPFLHAGRPSDGTPALSWEEVPLPQESASGREIALAIAPRTAVGEAPSEIGKFLASRRGERETHEFDRVLYVAFTRAKEQLHLLATLNPEKCVSADELKPASRSYLAKLWERFEEPFREAWERRAQATEAERAYPMLRRVEAFALPQIPEELARVAAAGGTEEVRYFKPYGVFETVDTAAGTVFHRLMERLASASSWDRVPDSAERLRPLVMEELRAMLPAEESLELVAERVVEGFRRMTASEKGRRHFAASNREIRGEQSIGYFEEGQWRTARIDRMYRDASGMLHVVDFKLVEDSLTAEKEFLAMHRARYEEQMEKYARLLQSQDGPPEPVRVTLYYPLQDFEASWTIAPRVATV